MLLLAGRVTRVEAVYHLRTSYIMLIIRIGRKGKNRLFKTGLETMLKKIQYKITTIQFKKIKHRKTFKILI